MHIGRIVGATHDLGAPKDWKPDEQGRCLTLPVRDDGKAMTSAWLPTPEEVAAIVAGAPVHLSLYGRGHPPVAVWVGEPPHDEAFAASTYTAPEADAA